MKKRSILGHYTLMDDATTSSTSSSGESSSTSRKASEEENNTATNSMTRYENLHCCLVCIEPFTGPKSLTCKHVFCEACLQEYSTTHAESLLEVVYCPVCSAMTELDGGLEDLKFENDLDGHPLSKRKISVITDGALQRCDLCIYRNKFEDAEYYCNKCNLNFCGPCKSRHDRQQLFKPHICIHIYNKEVLNVYCEKHVKQICTYFCTDCNCSMCAACVILDHTEHSCCRLNDTLMLKRENIKTMLNTLGPYLHRLEARLDKIQLARSSRNNIGEIGESDKTPNRHRRRVSRDESACQKTEVSIEMPISEKRGSLTKGETGTFRNIFTGRRQKLSESRQNSVESIRKESGGSRKSSDESCVGDSFDDIYVQDPKKEKRKKKKSIFQAISFGTSKDITEENVKLTTFKQLSLSPSKTSVSDNGVPPGNNNPAAIPVGRYMYDEATMSYLHRKAEHIKRLFALTSNVLEMSQTKKLLIVYEDLLSRIQKVIEHELPSVSKKMGMCFQNGREKVKSSQSCLKGVKEQMPIAGKDEECMQVWSMDNDLPTGSTTSISPAMLYKPKMVWKVENQSHDSSDLSSPCGMVFLPDGNLVLAEYDIGSEKGNRLQIWGPHGQTLHCFEQGNIKPLGVTVNCNGNILVTDCKDKRVKIYTPNGEQIGEFGKGQFGWPYGITCTKRGQVIVSDAFSDTISIFSNDGKRIKQFGSSGYKQNQFRNPYHIAVNGDDNIIVADSGNDCVKVYDPRGKFSHITIIRTPRATQFSDTVKPCKHLRRPKGVAVDIKNNLLVADSHNRIAMFENTDRFVRNLLTEDDSIKCPEALATCHNGLLAISEWHPHNMHSVKVFRMYE